MASRLAWRRLFLVLVLCAAGAAAQDDMPDVDSFYRASKWRATMIDDYLYIDGGEVSQVGFTEPRESNPMNSTLSIDCTTSWSPDTVQIREIQRPSSMPVLDEQSLLTDASASSFYRYGGYKPFGETADGSQLWRFLTDGEGGGAWTRESPSNATAFLSLNRSEAAAHTSTPDAGFIFGGKVVNLDSQSLDDNMKGFVSFNFTTKEWTEWTDDGGHDLPYSPDGSLFAASATYVQKYGRSGLIFLLGGRAKHRQPDEEYIDLRKIYFYDIAAQEWHSQITSGEAPAHRDNHCAVGAGGGNSNGTYEIFVYGGINSGTGKVFGDVYALSIPGFVWTKVSDDTAELRRSNHVCVNAGDSHILSLGGLDFAEPTRRDWWTSKDPFPRSIGIFDMNSLEWKDAYTISENGYKTNESILSWYEDGGLDDVPWSSEKVAALFIEGLNEDDARDSDETTDPNGDNPDASSSPSPTSIGGVVGGVVAGFVAINALGALAWFMYRRRRRADSKNTSVKDDENVERKLSPPPPLKNVAELQSHSLSKSLPSLPKSEVADSELEDTGRAELADTGRWKRFSAAAKRYQENTSFNWI